MCVLWGKGGKGTGEGGVRFGEAMGKLLGQSGFGGACDKVTF